MHRITVRGKVLTFPKMCCCCGDPKTGRRYKAQAESTGRWGDERYRERRWWYFPICTRCDRWIRATQASKVWFVLFVVLLVLGVVAPWVVLGLLSNGGLLCGVLALCLLGFSAIAFALWQHQRSQSLRLDRGPRCSLHPVVLRTWWRDENTFEFANADYFHQFMKLNRHVAR
jgi:hypothetical protein